MLNRATQEALAKRYASRSTHDSLKKAFDLSVVDALNQKSSPEGEAHSAVVFIDIAGFSQSVFGFSVAKTRAFLDDFYAVAVPEIYNRSGHIDRIVGDGIVAIFSSFLPGGVTDSDASVRALGTVEAIVQRLHGTAHHSKAALVDGTLLFCRTGLTDIYEDYTVIGSALTTAYRIEAIGKANEIIFPAQSNTGQHVDQQVAQRNRYESAGLDVPSVLWSVSSRKSVVLRGIGSMDLTVQTYCP